MNQKIPLFFKQNFCQINSQEESPLAHIQKTIDALIAYNKSLMSRLIKESHQGVIEFILSLYLGLDEIPHLDNKNIDLDTRLLKKLAIDNIITDIKLYEKIKLQFDKNDLDYVYLSIFFTKKVLLNGLWDSVSENKVQSLLSLFFPGQEARKKSKQINDNMRKQSNNLPLMVECNILADLLRTLKPLLSPFCVRILENISIEFQGTKALVTIVQYESARLQNKNIKYLESIECLSGYSSNPPPLNLILEYYELVNEYMPTMVSDVFDGFIDLSSKMKTIYHLEAQIDQLIPAEVTQKKNAPIIKKLAQEPSPKNDKAVSRSRVSAKIEHSQQQEAPEEKVQTATTPLIISLPEFLETETTSALDNKPLPAFAEPVINLVETVELLPTLTTELKEAVTGVDVKDNEQSQEELVYIYQPYYKQAEKITQQAQKNTLNLKDDDMDTYLKVFGFLPYETINLRALVKLTLNFGGEIETTGANRCRMKIKNIYAFIAVPQEALEKACNSATITMHGGGHRGLRSQNSDRENAPTYLVEQFKDAFTRAGFTPVNLGLSMDTHVTSAFR